jgi:hypothetical protein
MGYDLGDCEGFRSLCGWTEKPIPGRPAAAPPAAVANRIHISLTNVELLVYEAQAVENLGVVYARSYSLAAHNRPSVSLPQHFGLSNGFWRINLHAEDYDRKAWFS